MDTIWGVISSHLNTLNTFCNVVTIFLIKSLSKGLRIILSQDCNLLLNSYSKILACSFCPSIHFLYNFLHKKRHLSKTKLYIYTMQQHQAFCKKKKIRVLGKCRESITYELSSQQLHKFCFRYPLILSRSFIVNSKFIVMQVQIELEQQYNSH